MSLDVSHNSIFSMYLKPSFDFCQEILSMGEDMEVIAPLSFRKEMKNIFNKLISNYN